MLSPRTFHGVVTERVHTDGRKKGRVGNCGSPSFCGSAISRPEVRFYGD